MVMCVHGSSNFIRITIVLLKALGFGLIPANALFSCVRRCRMEEEGQMRWRLLLSPQLLALMPGWVGWPCAVAGSQGTFPLKQMGLPGVLLPCAFFCPLQAAPGKRWHAWHDFAPKSYKWACRLVIYILALLLSWNCHRVLYGVGSAVLASSKDPMDVAEIPLSTERVRCFCACCCRLLQNRNLEDCFQRLCFLPPDSQ